MGPVAPQTEEAYGSPPEPSEVEPEPVAATAERVQRGSAALPGLLQCVVYRGLGVPDRRPRRLRDVRVGQPGTLERGGDLGVGKLGLAGDQHSHPRVPAAQMYLSEADTETGQP